MGATLSRDRRSHNRLRARVDLRPWVEASGRAPIRSSCAGGGPARSLSRYRRGVAISRAVPNIRSDQPAQTRDFFVDLFGLEVAMDMGWVLTLTSPNNPSVQISIVSGDDLAAPGITVQVADVDDVHARAVEKGVEIVYPLRDEVWGVRRFMLHDPNGTVVNVVSHLPT